MGGFVKLIVLAKEPIPGRVKTRLCPPFSPDQAAELAGAAISDTIEVCLASTADEVIVVLDGVAGEWLPSGVAVVPQHGAGLDDRLANAWDDCGGPALQIGMDTPQITVGLLDQALSRVASGESVLGPATDGGWWAIGLQMADRRVFEGVPMSSSNTGKHQFERMLSLGLNVGLLPPLCDVDTAADAAEVARLAPGGRFAAAVERLRGLEVGERSTIQRLTP